jgi:ABC-type branched-subunit amino acid transport system ATPase component
MLTISGLFAGYGSGDVLRGVDLTVSDGSVTCVVGPNGAGKSTLLKIVSGLLRPRLGSVNFRGTEIGGASPRKILQAGIVQVMGLEPRSAALMYASIKRMTETGRTILLVEQNVRVGLGLADHGVVMETGRVRLEGTGAEILANPQMRALYLGGTVEEGEQGEIPAGDLTA